LEGPATPEPSQAEASQRRANTKRERSAGRLVLPTQLHSCYRCEELYKNKAGESLCEKCLYKKSSSEEADLLPDSSTKEEEKPLAAGLVDPNSHLRPGPVSNCCQSQEANVAMLLALLEVSTPLMPVN
jgi:hypothetical protein